MTRTENIGINFDSFVGLPFDLIRSINESRRNRYSEDRYTDSTSDGYIYLTVRDLDGSSDD